MTNSRIIKLTIKTQNGTILNFTIQPGKLLSDNNEFIKFIDRDGRVLEYNKSIVLSKEEMP
jgi:hypothetical protein